MKTLKKMFALVLACVMMLAMGATAAFAAELTEGTKDADKTITITTPGGAKNSDEFTYTVYKVFDATTAGDAISYKIDSANGELTDAMKIAGFSVDAQGNVSFSGTGTELSTDAISAIAAYAKDSVGTVKITGAGQSKTVTVPDYGYYYITTTAGTAVVINSTKPYANVTDKNVFPTVKKSAGSEYDENAKKAIAAVGTDQPFTAVVNTGKSASNVEFSDTMTNMTYNGDVVVTVDGQAVNASNYTVKVAAGNSSFTVAFTNDYIKNLGDNKDITLKYSAKVTSEALSTDPAKNTATVSYGSDPDHKYTSEPSEVEVYNAKVTVNKVDGNNQPLAGAKFKLKNADGKYYAGSTKDGTANWTTDGVEVEAAEVTADDGTKTYEAVFKGLGAGTYTLEESTVPAGYNKAADQTITVKEGDYEAANLEQTATVVNNAGSALPTTGGMGTTIFYILGAILVLGAGVVLVARKRIRTV